MTTTESLLFTLAEECAEVAQRASKAARFGLTEVQEGQPHDNAGRIMSEYADLSAVVEMLQSMGALPGVDRSLVERKKKKVLMYLDYSRQLGTVVVEGEV